VFRIAHILNMSPPLDLTMVPGRIAYAISKFGMTLLTHGLAEEVRPHNVAVNSLWPVTIIESQASINHRLGTPALWRKPDILVDCVLRLVQKDPATVTGQALLDEDFLHAEGVPDFSGYACVPGTDPPRISWAQEVPLPAGAAGGGSSPTAVVATLASPGGCGEASPDRTAHAAGR
jgi:citronellol/citronellal dehydrogenase